MQPLPHFTNNSDFTIQRPTALCNFNNLITIANTIYKLPENGVEAQKYVGAFVM